MRASRADRDLGAQTYKQKAERPDITAVLIDPGWVKTGEPMPPSPPLSWRLMDLAVMGGEGAMLEVDFAVSHIVKLISSLTVSDSGKFFRYDGGELPW